MEDHHGFQWMDHGCQQVGHHDHQQAGLLLYIAINISGFTDINQVYLDMKDHHDFLELFLFSEFLFLIPPLEIVSKSHTN